MSYDWLIELLLGMLLGFFAASTKFRQVIKHYLFNRNKRPSYQEQVEAIEQEKNELELPETEISATELAEYLKNNPNITITGIKKK